MGKEQQTLNVFNMDGKTYVNAIFVYESMNYKTIDKDDFLMKFRSTTIHGGFYSISYDEMISFLQQTVNNPMLRKSKPEAAKILQLLQEEHELYNKLQGSLSGGFVNWIKGFF